MPETIAANPVAPAEQSAWKHAQEAEAEFWRYHQDKHIHECLRKPLWKYPLRLALRRLGLRNYSMPTGDADNYWWKRRFDDYAFLPERIETLLELGCGPHTNLRTLIEDRRVVRAQLSDPLVPEYLKLERTWLRYAVTNGLACCDAYAAEECPYRDDQFDVVLMINVLEHVKDPQACCRNAIRVAKPGGIVVIGEDLASDASLRDAPAGYDIMHPHHMTRELLDQCLLPHLEPLVYKILGRQECRDATSLDGTYLLAGRKRCSR